MNSKVYISNVLDDFFKQDNITELIESKEDMSIDFISERHQFLSFSFDKDLSKSEFPKGLFPFFRRGEPKVCSFCDYLIFSENNSKLYVLLIELKSGGNNVTKQLEAGKCFAEYVIATINRVYSTSFNPEFRKISIRKKHLKPKPKQKQKVITYDSSGFYTFNENKFYLKRYLN